MSFISSKRTGYDVAIFGHVLGKGPERFNQIVTLNAAADPKANVTDRDVIKVDNSLLRAGLQVVGAYHIGYVPTDTASNFQSKCFVTVL